jgi:metallo-beta-lactamase class B
MKPKPNGARVRKKIRLTALTLLAAGFAGIAPTVLAPAATMADLTKLDPKEIAQQLAANPPLFLQVVSKASRWNEPAEPVKIAGPIYFVGTKGLGVWLIKTSTGLILLNTGMPESGPLIEASIRKLGFRPEDIRLLLACHAHIDHVGALAHLHRLSGAPVAIMDVEQALLESGGKADFHYAAYPQFAFESVKADRVFQDGETITFGDAALTAHLTPGHTKGATTFTMTVEDGGKTYHVVFLGGSSVNPGFRVAKSPSYPGIGDDYRRTLRILGDLKPDIWLDAHTETMDFEAKRARAEKEGAPAWVDPDGYAQFVAGQRAKFEAAAETAAPTPRGVTLKPAY